MRGRCPLRMQPRCDGGSSISKPREHPFTHAAPGAWAWTPMSGGVPDADDTSGALLALRRLGDPDPETIAAASQGVRWLLGVQNRDGGIPTFCRGLAPFPSIAVLAKSRLTRYRPGAPGAWSSIRRLGCVCERRGDEGHRISSPKPAC